MDSPRPHRSTAYQSLKDTDLDDDITLLGKNSPQTTVDDPFRSKDNLSKDNLSTLSRPTSTCEPSLTMLKGRRFLGSGVFRQRSHADSTKVERSPELSREFKRNSQLFKIVAVGLCRWLLTVLLIGAICIVFKKYSEKDFILKKQQNIFNIIVTGIPVALGLNILAGFKDNMATLRWKILAHRARDIEEVDLVLRASDLLVAMQLIFRTSHRTRVPLRLGFLLWLILNLATQIGLGIIGLTYELGHVQVYQPITDGDVWVTNMTNFQFKYDSNEHSKIYRGAQAHEYGSAAALSYSSLYLGPQKSDPFARYYFTDSQSSEYVYIFKEYSLPYSNKFYVQTNRSVTVTPKCQKITLDYPWPNINDTIFWKENGRRANFSLPVWLPNNTMYSLPDTGVSLNKWCGPRCARLWVYQLLGTRTAPEAYFYQCNITVSEVENAQKPIHELPDDMAQYLAIAIGRTGYYDERYPEGTQTQVYNVASPYNPTRLGVESVIEDLIASFSAGAVSELDQSNIRVESTGSISADGVQLMVKWKYVILLFGLIGIGQLAIMLVIALVANSVIVTEDTTLHIAKYLNAQVSHLGSGGSLLKRTEMAQQIGGKIIYSVSGDNHEDHPDHSYRVGFGPALRKGESKGLRKRSWFPEGRYN